MKRCTVGIFVLIALLGFPAVVFSNARPFLTPVSREPDHIPVAGKMATAPVQYALETPRDPSAPLDMGQEALKRAVSDAFPDVPAMVAIAGCESGYRQLTASGTPLISRTDDVGVMQINIPTWAADARARGLDIYHSAADNIAEARVVYERQGIHAWTCAK